MCQHRSNSNFHSIHIVGMEIDKNGINLEENHPIILEDIDHKYLFHKGKNHFYILCIQYLKAQNIVNI